MDNVHKSEKRRGTAREIHADELLGNVSPRIVFEISGHDFGKNSQSPAN